MIPVVPVEDFDISDLTDDDLAEMLIERYADGDEAAAKKQADALVKKHGGVEQALDAVQANLQPDIDRIVQLAEEIGQKRALEVAVRMELEERLPDDGPDLDALN